jgi:hypothetical protein
MAWLPPEQYIATLPKATVYGCFFVTDLAVAGREHG